MKLTTSEYPVSQIPSRNPLTIFLSPPLEKNNLCKTTYSFWGPQKLRMRTFLEEFRPTDLPTFIPLQSFWIRHCLLCLAASVKRLSYAWSLEDVWAADEYITSRSSAIVRWGSTSQIEIAQSLCGRLQGFPGFYGRRHTLLPLFDPHIRTTGCLIREIGFSQCKVRCGDGQTIHSLCRV